MRILHDFRWLLVLTLAALALPLVLFVAVKSPSSSASAKATPALVALAEATATSVPTAVATLRPKDTATARPTSTSVPTAVSTATPLPTEEVRPEPASRGGARPEVTETEEPQAVEPAPAPPEPTPTNVPPPPPPAATRAVAAVQPAVGSEITFSLDLLNRARAAAGQPALQLDAAISTAARLHAEEMAANDYLAHVNRQGQQPWDRMRAQGVQFGYAAENLGRAWADKGPAETAIKQMFDMMMAETPPNDGHKVNILSPKARRVGIGVARVSGWVYWVTDFAD